MDLKKIQQSYLKHFLITKNKSKIFCDLCSMISFAIVASCFQSFNVIVYNYNIQCSKLESRLIRYTKLNRINLKKYREQFSLVKYREGSKKETIFVWMCHESRMQSSQSLRSMKLCSYWPLKILFPTVPYSSSYCLFYKYIIPNYPWPPDSIHSIIISFTSLTVRRNPRPEGGSPTNQTEEGW